LAYVFAVLRRRSLGVLLCVIIAAGAAVGASEHQPKKYTATASLLFNDNQLSQQVAGLQPTVNNDQQSQQDTNVELVEIGDMAARTASRLGQGLTKQKVIDALSVSPQSDTTVVNVSATSPSPILAAEIANTYSSLFVSERQTATSQYYKSALTTVNRQLARLSAAQRLGVQGLALQDRAQSLATLAQLRTDVQVAQPASNPTIPSSPHVLKNVIVGAMLGLFVGLLIAFLLERFDQRIREPADLAAIYSLPLLGVVPRSSALSSSHRRGKLWLSSSSHRRGKPQAVLPSRESEAFQMISAQLRYFNIDHELCTVLVVSAAPGDGKTTIARRLAAAAASTGSRILLVEADLRRPQLAHQLDLARGPGLSEVLLGSVSMETAIEQIALETTSADASNNRTLDVLAAGAGLAPNPAELLQSDAMERVLERACSIKAGYDLVVIDTSPLVPVSDAIPLLRKVDGVLVVGRVGRNRRDVSQRLSSTLTLAGAPLLGVVANGVKARRHDPYGYTYGADRGHGGSSSVALSSPRTASHQ